MLDRDDIIRANAPEKVEQISRDKKDRHKCSLCVSVQLVCIAKCIEGVNKIDYQDTSNVAKKPQKGFSDLYRKKGNNCFMMRFIQNANVARIYKDSSSNKSDGWQLVIVLRQHTVQTICKQLARTASPTFHIYF